MTEPPQKSAIFNRPPDSFTTSQGVRISSGSVSIVLIVLFQFASGDSLFRAELIKSEPVAGARNYWPVDWAGYNAGICAHRSLQREDFHQVNGQ